MKKKQKELVRIVVPCKNKKCRCKGKGVFTFLVYPDKKYGDKMGWELIEEYEKSSIR